MKIFLISAGIFIVLYIAAVAFILFKDFPGHPGKNDAADTIIFVGGAALIGLILGIGSIMVLWNRFVLNNTSISNVVWILAALCLLSLFQGGSKFLIDYFNPPKDISPDNKNWKP